jgi:sugar lactone lactonase YvrE
MQVYSAPIRRSSTPIACRPSRVADGSISPSRFAASIARIAPLLLLGTSVLAWVQQAPAAVMPLAGTPVGQQSQPMSATISVVANGTSAQLQALTEGIAGLDFSIAPGGTCAVNTVYLAGQQCTVNVVFGPKYPGLRLGAVELTANDGSLLGSALIEGTATGSLSVLNPGIINTLAGDGELNFRADNVPATQAPIFLPYGVIADPAGNIYLCDTNNNRVRRVDAQTGIITTVAGVGSSGYSGDGGPATQAMISQPGGLTMDGGGNLYFADSGNSIIRRIDAVSGIITTVAGVPAAAGYTGDGYAATQAKLSSPRGVAFDAAGDLFIADTSNNAIREVSLATGIIGTVAGTGVAGYNGDAIPAIAAQLNSPWTVSIGADNALYIADLSNNRVRKVSGGVISTVAGTGSRGFAGDTGAANAADLNDPTSVILDPAGDLYIADSGNNRVRKVYASTGVILTITGNDSEQFGGDAGPSNQATLYAPYALFFDQVGNLLIADTLHNRIRRILATPFPLEYPVMRVGKTSLPQVEALENDGNRSLNLSPAVLNNAALDPATTTCSFSSPMASSAACNLGVQFAPTVVGNNVLGSITLNSDAGNGPAIVNLSGQVLSVEPTTVALTSSVNPSLVGQLVTLTATVSSADPSRSGPVTFLDGATVVCSNINLNGGSAICSVSTLALGQHNLTASYAGDTNNAASVSSVLVQVVKQQPTLSLAASPNPVVVLQSVTLTLTASAGTGTPSGSVIFYDGSSAISGSVALSVGGIASFSTTQLTPGQHTLSAQYAGDAADAAGQSNVVAEVVNQASTVTTMASSNSNATVGAAVTFTATVISQNGPSPTGTVQFMDGSVALGTGMVDSNGHAVLPISTLTPGAHSITAVYGGDTDNSRSTSSAFAETIQQIPTVTSLSSDSNPASAGATIHLTATVAPGAGMTADGAITGLITFSEGTTILGTATVGSANTATLALSSLTPGQHNILASYPGNTNYAASASTVLVQTVTSTATTTVLTAGSANSLAGKPVVFTASVASATMIPTGNVIFEDGTANVGQAVLNAQGVAVFSTSSLAVGPHTITAVYQGNGSYTLSTSTPVVETISLATSAVTLAGPVNAVNVGTAIVFTVTLSSNGVAPTGALTLHDGSAVIATQSVTNTGTFTFSISTLAVGMHTLSAVYSGDGNNSAVSSSSIAVTVQPASTSTSLTASANPSLVGQTLTLAASVSSTGSNITGTMSFEDGGAVIGSAVLGANGTATLATTSLSLGAHSLTAVYSGDPNHSLSTSAAVSEQIVQPASIALMSSVNPSTSGINVLFTSKVAGIGSVIPTGTVIFSDGAATLATAQLDATGSASFQTSLLAVGSHSITASYSGDKSYAAVVSAALIQTVQSANTQIALTVAANPATYASPLALTATIASNGGVATGTVSFSDGGVAIGSATLNAAGVATLTTSSLSPGSHSIVATYAGDGKASASVSTPLAVSVRQTTSIALASSANPALTLSPIVLTASVTNAGASPVTGSVTFSDGATLLGTAAVASSGQATLALPSLAAGSHSLVAVYQGDIDNFSSGPSTLTQVVQLRATSTAVTATATDPGNSQQVTLIGIVRWTGPATPGGSITFSNGNTVIGSSAIDASGTATINITVDTGATQSVVATYSGDASYASSASPGTAVTGGAAAQFTLLLNPSSMTIQSKQHAAINLTATSVKGFADTLELGCLGLPYAATCTFSNVAASLAANGTSTVQLTIDTGDPLGAGAEARVTGPRRPNVLMSFLPAGALAGLLLFCRRRRFAHGLLLLLFASIAALSMTGCSGLQMNGTPAGTYTFKVTASGQGTGATESQIVTLTVTQ